MSDTKKLSANSPTPWREDEDGDVVDANGQCIVIDGFSWDGSGRPTDDPLERADLDLVLASVNENAELQVSRDRMAEALSSLRTAINTEPRMHISEATRAAFVRRIEAALFGAPFPTPPVPDAVKALVALVRWIDVSDFAPSPWNGRVDHACAECVPGGEIVRPGFRCAYHAALALAKGTKGGE